MGRPKKVKEPDENKEELKSFHFEMPRELWVKIKTLAMIEDKKMRDLIIDCLQENMSKITVTLKKD